MALYFIKDTTLKGIADAIRTKTGDSASIPVADFASKIESIVVGDGSSSGGGSGEGGTVLGYEIISQSGFFETGSGVTSATITHNCGGKPDIVIVYLRRNDLTICGDYTTFVYSTSKINVGNLAITSGYANQGSSSISCSNTTFNVSDLAGNSRYGWHAMKLVDKEISGSGGGDHTVTFMSEDGSTVLCRKSVMNGDSCGDPITLGLIEKPAKESTAEFTYSFAGWSTTPGGELDPDALANITGDKTVYASFVGVIRLYTIKYYDGDTLLHSENLPYGAMPSYTPDKAGYVISGWVPEFTTVTGDADYQVQWEYLTLSSASWERIAEISESGMAKTYFSLGDTKTFTFKRSGATVTGTAVIIGFDHDDKADGSGKAGITFMLVSGIERVSYLDGAWATSSTRTLLNTTIFNTFETEMQSAIKTVTKLSCGGSTNATLLTTEDKLFLPCLEEIGKTPDGTNFLKGEGTKYEGYPDASKFTYDSSSFKQYLTRSAHAKTAGRYAYVQSTGSWSNGANIASEPKFCFCV